jgi:hypothetical protein
MLVVLHIASIAIGEWELCITGVLNIGILADGEISSIAESGSIVFGVEDG